MGAIAMMGLTALLLTGTLETPQVLAGFANATVWLVVCAYLLAGAFIRTGLGPRIAYLFLSVLGHRALGLSYSLAATDLVLAPFIPSHTARSGGAIFPILQSVARSFGPDGNADARRTAGFVTMATYQASISTSAMFLTSMAGNPLAAEFAGQQGITITWGSWLAAALVPGLVSLILVPLVIHVIYPPTIRHTPQARVAAKEQLSALGPLRRDERILLVTFAALVVAWALSGSLGIDNTVAAFGAIAVLLLTRVLLWDQVAREHEAWNTFVWFAALIMMASELARLGVPKSFAGVVSVAVGDVHWTVGFLGVSLAYFYSHYLFASNTAHISAMYAAFLAIALTLGTPPLLAAFTLAFFSNLFAGLTHYSAATAPIFFAGRIRIGCYVVEDRLPRESRQYSDLVAGWGTVVEGAGVVVTLTEFARFEGTFHHVAWLILISTESSLQPMEAHPQHVPHLVPLFQKYARVFSFSSFARLTDRTPVSG